MKNRKGIILGAALLLCLLLILPVTNASAAGRQNLRAGLYAAPRYAYQNDDGSYAGADVEYAYRIAQKAGFGLTIVLYNNETQMTADLDSGAVDMLFDFGKTDERQQNYLFSENPIGSSVLSLYVRSDDTRYTYGDVSQLPAMVFGCESGNANIGIFQNWCASYGFQPQIREFANRSEIDAALDAGAIDGAIISENGHAGYTTLQILTPQNYYILFRKTDTALKNNVDSAMNKILANEPLYEQQLLQKYNISTIGTPGFTTEEKNYIADHPALKVAVVRNDAPYYWQKDDGSDQGIIPDYYQKLGEAVGLSFSFNVYDTNTDAIAAVKSGEADVLAMYSDGVITAENNGILLTDAYENVDSVLLTRADTGIDEITKIAVKERSVNNVRQSIANLNNADILPVSNASAGFEALRSGEADAMVCGLPTATWLLNQTDSSAYRTAILSSLQFDLCGATAVDNPTLSAILDKAISTTKYGFEGIVEDNTGPMDSWQVFISRIDPAQSAAIILLFFCIIIALVLALISMIRRAKEKAQIQAAREENAKQQLQLKAIEKNAEEKNKFFSDVSHDMRTPLTAILGFSDLIEKETDLEKIKDDNQKIKTSGALLLDLINDTLLLSKINNGKLSLTMVPVDSAELFDAVITPIRMAAQEKQVQFSVDRTQAKKRTILADPLNSQKILLNLLSNAVKYTPPGGHVWLSLSNPPREDGGSPDTIIVVRDDGIGMTQDFQQHMFEPFAMESRAGYGSTGTGLGLSIVSELVNLMGGTITVTSEKNQGTTFTLHLHFDEAGDAPIETPEITEALDTTRLAGKRILLLEDNALNREIAKALLQDRGLIVTSAENGQEGLAVFTSESPGTFDAILTDLRMPVMDGYATAKAIRQLNRPDAAAVPIIAMTADASVEDVQRCLDAGMEGHVAKPIDPDQLFSVLLQTTVK